MEYAVLEEKATAATAHHNELCLLYTSGLRKIVSETEKLPGYTEDVYKRQT